MTSTWWARASGSRPVSSSPLLQIAADGDWETATVLPVAADPSDVVTCIGQVAATAQSDLAVEVLWPGEVFVGARWSSRERDAAGDGATRAQAAVTAAGTAADTAASTPPVRAALLALLGAEPSLEPDFAEVGAVNAWASIGPLRVWRAGEAFAPTVVDELLAARPDLTQCAHPVAVELAADHPRPCWVGITVSTPTGSGHRLDRGALGDVLARSLRPSR